jgi:hypothetical protein
MIGGYAADGQARGGEYGKNLTEQNGVRNSKKGHRCTIESGKNSLDERRLDVIRKLVNWSANGEPRNNAQRLSSRSN